MDDIQKIKREKKAALRKKRDERLKQREEERKNGKNGQPWRPFYSSIQDTDQKPPLAKKSAARSPIIESKSPAAKSSRPLEVAGSPAGASVASSITFSQSPACQKKKSAKKPWEPLDGSEDEKDRSTKKLVRKKQQTKPSADSDEDDLVASAKKLARKKQKETGKLAPRAAAKKPSSDSDEDDDGLLRAALLIEKRRKKSKSATSHDSSRRDYGDEHNNGKKRTSRAKSSDDADSDDDGLLQDALWLAAKKKTNYPAPPAQKSVRTPRDDDSVGSLGSDTSQRIDGGGSQKSFMSTNDEEPMESTPPLVEPSAKVVAGLWSDSEDERPPKESESKPAAQRRSAGQKRKRKDADGVAKTASPKKASKPTEKKSRLSVDQDDLESDAGGDGEEIRVDELKPYFANPRLGEATDLVALELVYSGGTRRVPAAINRYLQAYQREGVVFMHNRVAEGQGAILGDDMGLGKTVQVIALLAALLKKKGSGEDLIALKERRKAIQGKRAAIRKEQDRAIQTGKFAQISTKIEGLKVSKWAPILIVVPSSVIENWMSELSTWGHFGAVKYQGASRDRALERIRLGLDEVMVCGRSLFQGQMGCGDLQHVKQVAWKLIVVDEYHQYKNCKTTSYRGLKSLKETCGAPMIGLTGTLMQNNHKELWSEVDLVNPDFLGTWEEFQQDTSVPIKMGRTRTADDTLIEESTEVRDWLRSKLKSFYIQRLKTEVLKDALPQKDERVLFCELSSLQKRLYMHMMTLPDFVLLKYANAPCECGVNQAIFQGFKQMRTEAEKVAFQRAHREDIVPRKKCCYVRPLNPSRFEAGEEFYDPRAPLWRWQHQEIVRGEEGGCIRCPYCISFPALDKLYKLSSHVALLQVPKHPDEFIEGSRAGKEAQKALDFAHVAFPEDVVDSLSGGYIRDDGIMNDHASLSGKMKVLAELLVEFDKRNDRLLLFSFSTQTLDLIQNFVRAQGYTFLRLDGSTPTKARQGLVDRYQNDKSIFLFLISTKAGGLGLNLTAANVVIVFDVDFNPSNDEQSQDRAYRIGQKRDVLVIRLVSRGTVEELKYIRQIYKVQLKKDTIGSGKRSEEEPQEAARLFDGVIGDKQRKGELFGMENLLKYKDGSFMDDLWKSSNEPNKSYQGLEKFGLRSNFEISNGVEGMSEEEVGNIGGDNAEEKFREAASATAADSIGVSELLAGGNAQNHEDFLRGDRGDALYKPGDEGFDEQMGGCSQGAYFILENAPEVQNDDAEEQPSAPSPVVSGYQQVRHGPSPVRSSTTGPTPHAHVPAAAVPSPVRSALVAAPSPVRSAPVPRAVAQSSTPPSARHPASGFESLAQPATSYTAMSEGRSSAPVAVPSPVKSALTPQPVAQSSIPSESAAARHLASDFESSAQPARTDVARLPGRSNDGERKKPLQPVLGTTRSGLTAKDLFLGKKNKKKKKKKRKKSE